MSENDVVMYSTRFCPFCIRAKLIFKAKNIKYHDIDVGRKPELRQEMMKKSGQRTVPQIWIGEQHIGGCDELMSLERSNQLDPLLSALSTGS